MKCRSRNAVSKSRRGGAKYAVAAVIVALLAAGGGACVLWRYLTLPPGDNLAVQAPANAAPEAAPNAAANAGSNLAFTTASATASATASITASRSPFVEAVDRRRLAIQSVNPLRLSGRLVSAASAERLASAAATTHVAAYLPRPDAVIPALATGGFDVAAARPILLTSASTAAVEPPLETARRAQEQSAGGGSGIQITAGFSGSTPVSVEQISATHYSVALATVGFQDWFMFRIRGAAGRPIRIDIKPTDNLNHRWSTLNPLWTAADDLGSPATYLTPRHSAAAARAWNGAVLPPQTWHAVANCWMPDERTFSLVQQFDGDVVTLAMRVPYTAEYNAAVMADIARAPEASRLARVDVAGTSRQGRPLYVVTIADDVADRQRPCVVLYAGEHADEQDAMWAARGAIGFLLSAAPAAIDLRHRYQFVIIPQIDPDASAAGEHSGVILSFMSDRETAESEAFANWFQGWVNAGNRLDVVIDLHNEQSGEMPAHLLCAWTEGVGARGELGAALHEAVIKQAGEERFKINKRISHRGWSPDRLGGWLSRRYGAISALYEINGQEGSRHLSVDELQKLGGLFVRSTSAFLLGPGGTPLLNEVDARRSERDARWAAMKNRVPPGSSAIVAEAIVSWGVGLPSGVLVAASDSPATPIDELPTAKSTGAALPAAQSPGVQAPSAQAPAAESFIAGSQRASAPDAEQWIP